MSLTIKVLQQGSGYKTPTKAARLGGMITSVDTGYTGDQATVALDTGTGEYFWVATGTTGTSLAWHYDTAVACATGKKVYFAATVETTSTGIDSIEIRVGGTTAGEITVMTQTNPTANTRYRLAGIATLTASETGNVKLRVRMADTAGTTGKVLRVYNWQAIDLTTEFGAGSEPASADLETFYAWRFEGHVYSNYGMYHSYGDTFYKALKVASHGLEYNDTIMHRITLAAPELYYMFSNVYVLNSNWIVVNTYSNTDDGASLVDFNYWTKVDYTSRLLAKTLQTNLRHDMEGRCSMSLLGGGSPSWKPRLGMTVFVYSGTECLYSGRLTRMTTSELNATNWRCDCEISPMIETLSWMPFEAPDAEALTYGTTRNAIEHVVFDYGNKINLDSDTGSGCLCFWRGRQDVGLAKAKLKDSYFKSMYDVVSSLCKSAGLTFYATPDRHFVARETSATPENAPRDITDAANPDYWDATYTSDMADYGNIFVLFGGNDDDGEQVVAVDSGVEAIEVRYTGGAARKAVWMSDSGIVDDTEALAVAAKYTPRYGTVIPGNFTFTTSDLDYRYGQKINVQVASLGITATQTMLITDVLLYDADGINLLCQVSCTNRDSADFDSGASGGSNAAMADLSSSASKIVTALTQSAGTFTPTLVGSTDPGTFTYTTQTGQYVRHGNMVYVSIKLVINAVSSAASGTLRIAGLPFAAANRIQQLPVFTDNVDFPASRTQVQLTIAASDTYGSLYASGDNVGWSAIDAASCTAADDIRVSGWYQVVV